MTTRVVVPYTRLHPATAASIAEHAPHAELTQLAETDGLAYWRLLDTIWRDGRDVVIIEHDNALRADVLPSFDACPRLWCTFPYQGEHALIPRGALGCVRFRGMLMTRDPDLWMRFDRRHWQRLDSELSTRLMHPPFTIEPCVHTPPILHYHVYA